MSEEIIEEVVEDEIVDEVIEIDNDDALWNDLNTNIGREFDSFIEQKKNYIQNWEMFRRGKKEAVNGQQLATQGW